MLLDTMLMALNRMLSVKPRRTTRLVAALLIRWGSEGLLLGLKLGVDGDDTIA